MTLSPFVVIIEGCDGAGKSTLAASYALWLTVTGKPARVVRDPGATMLGEVLRKYVLLDPKVYVTPLELTLLFTAVRSSTARMVERLLSEGTTVVLDRWVLSTFVYQGLAGVPDDFVRLMHSQVSERDWEADADTFVLDVPFDTCEQRLRHARSGVANADRFEGDAVEVRRHRWQRYRDLAAELSLPFLDGSLNQDDLLRQLIDRTDDRHRRSYDRPA